MATTAELIAMAMQAHEAGEISLAEQWAWSVLLENANHPEALRLLGILAWEKGDSGQAIDYLNRSLICDSSSALTWKELGDVHLAGRDFLAAVANYEQVLRLQPDFADAYNKLGMALHHLGHRVRAAEVFEAGLRLQPDNPEIAFNLATTLYKDGKFDQAVSYYRQTLRLKPNYADASSNLATIFKKQGLFDEAIAQFQETLKIQPEHDLATYNLSELAAEGRYQFTQEDIGRIKALIASGHCSPLELSLYSFTLATVFNKQGSYDEAFSYYQRANDLRRGLLQEKNKAFEPQRHRALVERIVTIYDKAYFERIQGWGTDTELPIFIIGMPRSGSTLVEQILASHPRVYGAGEIGEISRYVSRLAADAHADRYTTPVPANQRASRDLASAFLRHITALGQGAARVTVKTLDNFLHLGVIATLFPGARIIHTRRDPLDVCLSCYIQNFEDMSFSWSLKDIGAYHRSYERLMAHWSKVLPLHVHEIRYEDLVHNQETITRNLLSFCELDWDERCLTFFDTRRVVRTASTVQVRKPMSTHAIGRWKHYRSHLGPLFKALGRSAEVNKTRQDYKSEVGGAEAVNASCAK
jgi:tetratricopeptide (TPR) repeat protein